MNEYGIQWQEVNRNDQVVTKQKFFKTQAALDKFVANLYHKDRFVEVLAYCEREEK